jgi:hypothetical protein
MGSHLLSASDPRLPRCLRPLTVEQVRPAGRGQKRPIPSLAGSRPDLPQSSMAWVALERPDRSVRIRRAPSRRWWRRSGSAEECFSSSASGSSTRTIGSRGRCSPTATLRGLRERDRPAAVERSLSINRCRAVRRHAGESVAERRLEGPCRWRRTVTWCCRPRDKCGTIRDCRYLLSAHDVRSPNAQVPDVDRTELRADLLPGVADQPARHHDALLFRID